MKAAIATSGSRFAPGRQQRPTFEELKCSVTHSIQVRYLLYLPESDGSAARKWPLILFLHGSGERGSDLRKVRKHGLPKHALKERAFPFVVVAPQCPRGELWSSETLLALLRHALETHPVDPRRVYLTGLSMGGYAAWNLAVVRPELFAAVAPICGGGDTLPVLLSESAHTRALRRLPVWAFHGAKDTVVPLEESERMIAALRQIGNHPKLTIYPEAGHDAWTEAYSTPALYDWFLQQQSPAVKHAQ